MRVLILVDYCGAFYSSTTNTKTLCTMHSTAIKQYLTECGYDLCISSFADIDFSESYKGVYVIYTSSEDYELKYKSYIEDVVLALIEMGAILIPQFRYLRAHHNKCYMELLRTILFPEQTLLLETKAFGTLEEFRKCNFKENKYVIKSAYGAGSSGVKSVDSLNKMDAVVERISRSFYLGDILREFRRRLLWKGYCKHSTHRSKFVIQNFIEGLPGDFKVLKYGERFYTLYRKNREHDFRASGGGRLTFNIPDEVSESGLLSFAKNIADRLDTPLCSLDIAWDGRQFVLLEFQCICFGPYTAERSSHYHSYENDGWIRHDEDCNLEKVFCEAIDDWIKQNIANTDLQTLNHCD